MNICISIGHGKSAKGGYDSGALGGNYQEFKIGREIGKYIGEIFKGYACTADVINYDATLYLTDRIAHVNKHGYDLAIEIHLNASGGTDQIAWDSAKGFGDAVDAISSGGGNPLEAFESLQSFELSNNSTITEFVANIPNVTKLRYSFAVERANPLKRIELTVSDKLTDVSFMLGNKAGQSLTEIVFKGDFSKVKNVATAFACSGTGISDALKKIVGLDFTSVTNASNVFAAQRGLTDIEIKANTVNISLDLSYQPHLNIASCVNVLNALKDRTGQDALTLKLNAALKTADTGMIYANYVKLDANTNLYVSCESTDAGAVTIAAAITAKNWTIA